MRLHLLAKGGRRSTPGEPLIFSSACEPRRARSLLCPLSPPLSPPSPLARNTAPCFSWQNSEGRPCVPGETSQRAHFSHFLRRAPASPRLASALPHVVQAAVAGRDASFLFLSHFSLSPSIVASNVHNSLSLHPDASICRSLLALLRLQERRIRCARGRRRCSLMRQRLEIIRQLSAVQGVGGARGCGGGLSCGRVSLTVT